MKIFRISLDFCLFPDILDSLINAMERKMDVAKLSDAELSAIFFEGDDDALAELAEDEIGKREAAKATEAKHTNPSRDGGYWLYVGEDDPDADADGYVFISNGE